MNVPTADMASPTPLEVIGKLGSSRQID